MYETAASILYRNSGSEGWPRHYQNQDLYTFEQHFIYEYARTSLYEWQKHLGMLNPFAEVYYPPTEKKMRETNETSNGLEEMEKDSEDKEIPNDTEKEKDWKQTRKGPKVQYKEKNVHGKNGENKNQYSALDDGNNEEKEVEDSPNVNVDIKFGCIQEDESSVKYDVNEMGIKEMEEIIKQQKENDLKREREEIGSINECSSRASVSTEDQEDDMKQVNDELLQDAEEDFIDAFSIREVKEDKIVNYKEKIEAVEYQNALLSSRLEQSEKNEDTLSKDIKLLKENLNDERMKLALVETNYRNLQEEKHHMESEMEKGKEIWNEKEVELENQIKSLKDEKVVLKEECVSVRKKLDEYEDEMKKLKNEFLKVKNKCTEYGQEVWKLRNLKERVEERERKKNKRFGRNVREVDKYGKLK